MALFTSAAELFPSSACHLPGGVHVAIDESEIRFAIFVIWRKARHIYNHFVGPGNSRKEKNSAPIQNQGGIDRGWMAEIIY